MPGGNIQSLLKPLNDFNAIKTIINFRINIYVIFVILTSLMPCLLT
jgi:hypothetical protein